jgi:hypothetical protein
LRSHLCSHLSQLAPSFQNPQQFPSIRFYCRSETFELAEKGYNGRSGLHQRLKHPICDHSRHDLDGRYLPETCSHPLAKQNRKYPKRSLVEIPGDTISKIERKRNGPQLQATSLEKLNEKWIASDIIPRECHRQKAISAIQISVFWECTDRRCRIFAYSIRWADVDGMKYMISIHGLAMEDVISNCQKHKPVGFKLRSFW